jgi:hypothetical protein
MYGNRCGPGGLLALDVAKRLGAAKKEVAMVVILDQMPEEAKISKASFWYDSITKGGHMVKQAIALKHEKVCSRSKDLHGDMHGARGAHCGDAQAGSLGQVLPTPAECI